MTGRVARPVDRRRPEPCPELEVCWNGVLDRAGQTFELAAPGTVSTLNRAAVDDVDVYALRLRGRRP